jgi:hypothetical protein
MNLRCLPSSFLSPEHLPKFFVMRTIVSATMKKVDEAFEVTVKTSHPAIVEILAEAAKKDALTEHRFFFG